MVFQSGTFGQPASSACPQCGSSADVRAAADLFRMLNGARGQGTPGFAQPGGSAPASTGFAPADPGPAAPASSGSAPGSASAPAGDAAAPHGEFGPNPMAYQPGGPGDGTYDHYNVEGSDPRLARGGGRRDRGFDLDLGGNIAEDIGGAVLDAALGAAGRVVGRRMLKALQDRVVPAVQARAEQAMQQYQQQRSPAAPDEQAIAARYPELRGCQRDQVIFLDGGTQTVAVSELTLPVTLAQADTVVARLR